MTLCRRPYKNARAKNGWAIRVGDLRGGECVQTCHLQRVRGRDRSDSRSQASAGVVVVQVASGLPLWVGAALPVQASGSDQRWSLANEGGMTAHTPVPPLWSCAGCSLPWPCTTRRQELLALYDEAPVSLALYLGRCFIDAAQDLSWAPAGTLYRRFLGWLP